jgi:pyruvate dehydrogenase E2 component (dihydrolipoamide acetyltransferase)
MPALSPTMEEGALSRWAVKEGDRVKSGDVIAEIETDKATMEVEAVDEGVVGKLMVPEGAQGVKVNAVIAVLLADGESAADLSGGGAAKAAAPAAAPVPVAAPAPSPAPAHGLNGAAAPAAHGSRVFASPLARRIAKEKGLDLSAVKGSGPHGRVVKADVEGLTATPAPAAAPAAAAAPAPAPVAAAAAAPAPAVSADAVKKLYADRKFAEQPLDGMRRTIAARLTEAKQTIPHFYLRRDVELDALLAFRTELNAKTAARGVKLSVNDFVIKACALALKAAPGCNAVWAGDRVLAFEAADVGVAVAVEGGLFVPVIRDADAKSLSAISAEMKDLAARARSRKLSPHEYQGGAFAISNLGMMGIDNFDAVINPPHASILAVGAGVRKPVVKGDAIAPATVMSVTLSVDHRVIDGALGAAFLEAFKGFVEEPLTMLV